MSLPPQDEYRMENCKSPLVQMSKLACRHICEEVKSVNWGRPSALHPFIASSWPAAAVVHTPMNVMGSRGPALLHHIQLLRSSSSCARPYIPWIGVPLYHFTTSKCPAPAAASHARESHGQPLALHHTSTSKYPPLAAAMHVPTSH